MTNIYNRVWRSYAIQSKSIDLMKVKRKILGKSVMYIIKSYAKFLLGPIIIISVIDTNIFIEFECLRDDQ